MSASSPRHLKRISNVSIGACNVEVCVLENAPIQTNVQNDSFPASSEDYFIRIHLAQHAVDLIEQCLYVEETRFSVDRETDQQDDQDAT